MSRSTGILQQTRPLLPFTTRIETKKLQKMLNQTHFPFVKTHLVNIDHCRFWKHYFFQTDNWYILFVVVLTMNTLFSLHLLNLSRLFTTVNFALLQTKLWIA